MVRQANVSTLERAFELARSGAVRDVSELRRALNREGYNGYEIEGRALMAQFEDVNRGAAEE